MRKGQMPTGAQVAERGGRGGGEMPPAAPERAVDGSCGARDTAAVNGAMSPRGEVDAGRQGRAPAYDGADGRSQDAAAGIHTQGAASLCGVVQDGAQGAALPQCAAQAGGAQAASHSAVADAVRRDASDIGGSGLVRQSGKAAGQPRGDDAKHAGKICPWWVAYTFDNPLRQLMHPPQKLLGPYVGEGMRVVDIGCGLGHFSLGMARMVGPGGVVYAVDVQEGALKVLRRRARRAGLMGRMIPVLCPPRVIPVQTPVDFILACNVLHELPDPRAALAQAAAILRPGGRLYIMEPLGHVGAERFEQEVTMAQEAGLILESRPKVFRERSAIVRKEETDQTA